MSQPRTCESCGHNWRPAHGRRIPVYCRRWAGGGPAICLSGALEEKHCGLDRRAWTPDVVAPPAALPGAPQMGFGF